MTTIRGSARHASAAMRFARSGRSVFALTSLGAAVAGGQSLQAQAAVDVIDEVVVTARKRAESLQDVPIAVSVMQGAELESRGLGRVKDLQASIPNISLADAGNANANTALVIRGISTDARNAGFESGVSVYVDGVYTGRPLSFNQDFVDIERVEVLRGPQGTLFGKNTIAGAINITTVKPAGELSGKAALEYGNFDYVSGQAALNLPTADGKLATRVSAFGKSRDGVVRNPLNGHRYNDEGAAGGRVQMRWWAGSPVTVDLSADYLDEDRSHAFPETLEDLTAPGPRTTINDFEPVEHRSIRGGSVTVSYEMAGGATLTSISAYRRNHSAIANDNDNSTADILVADFADLQRQLTQEVRLVSPGGETVDYVAGLFYFNQEADQDHRGLFGPAFPPTGGTRVTINSLGAVDTTSYAAYADVQIRLTGRMELLAGLRYTHEEKDLQYAQLGELLPGIAFDELAPLQDSFSDDDLSPQLGLAFELSERTNLYVRAARGYKSGGWNADFIGSALVNAARTSPTGDGRFDPSDFDFQPEQATNYEAGMKGAWPDRGITANLALFHTDYQDLQISQFLGVLSGGTLITNAGKARIRGVEIELAAQPFERLRLDASVGHLQATFEEYQSCAADRQSCAGNRLPDAPRWTASAGIEYTAPMGAYALTLRGEGSYRSSVFTTPTNISRLGIEGYGLVNLFAALHPQDSSGFGASLWVKNLLDKDYFAGVINDDLFGSGNTFVGYGLPRTYGVRLQYTF